MTKLFSVFKVSLLLTPTVVMGAIGGLTSAVLTALLTIVGVISLTLMISIAAIGGWIKIVPNGAAN